VNIGTELRGSVATFLTMAYILAANPAILSAAGVPREAAVAATAAAAAICSIAMGLVAKFPLALASGMGLNAVVAYQVAPALGGWEAAMGLVVLDGLLAAALVVAGLREAVLYAIPPDLRRAIGVGIGLFLALVGLVNAKLVVVPGGTLTALAQNPLLAMPPVTFGSLYQPEPLVALIGLLVTGVLLARRMTGAILIGMIVATLVALPAGVATLPAGAWLSLPDFSTVGRADLGAALSWPALALLLPILMVDFFDTIGTATAVAESAGLRDAEGRIPNLKRLLLVDSLSATVGGWFGASSVTSYIESAAGIAEGARTGLHAIGVGVLFGLAVFAAPLALIVPVAATAGALVAVGFLMCQQIARIDFTALDTAIPAFILLITIPFTYSISHGIGYGFVAFAAIKVASGRWRDVHPLMYGTVIVFVAYFASSG
jgi:AGZA family xanthine/uracil permease-like MFS transporter